MEKEMKANLPMNKHRITKKPVVAILLVLLFAITGVLVFASKSPDVELIGGYYVTANNRGNYTIIGLDGTQSSTTLLVPEMLGDKTVDEIAGGAFTGSRMKNFIVPTTIEYVGKNAFDGEGVFYIYMVGRKDLSGMTVDENWSGAGEVIFQDVRPQINFKPDIKEVGDFASNTSRPSTDLVIEGELPFDESLLSHPDFSTDFNTQNPSISKDDEANKKSPMKRIEIVTPPSKIEYVEKTAFDPKGMLVKAVYEDGFSQLVSGYIYSKELLALGVNTVIISYSDSGVTQTANVSISVVKKQPIKLTVKNPPEKVKYVEGQNFIPDGTVFIAEYNNSETRTVTPNYVDIPLVLNQPNVEFTYSENGGRVKVNQPITVIKKVPAKLTIKTSATKTAYIEGNIFDKTGITLEVTDNDGEKKEVTDFTYPTEKLLFGETEALLTYTRDGVTVQTFQLITVRNRLPTKLEIITPPDKTLYIEDIPFSPDGLTTRATYDNGDVEMVIPTYDKSDLLFGQTEVKIIYEENTGKVDIPQPITVIKKTPTELKVKTQPDKRTYSNGLKFSKKGMEVEALYDNGKTYPVTVYTYPDVRLTENQTNVTLTHKENNATVTTDVPISVLAQMVVYEKRHTNKADCSTCSGSGRINTITECGACGGNGKITESFACVKEVTFFACTSCGKDYPDASAICADCKGTVAVAKRPCGICNGTGTGKREVTCATCNGFGQVGDIPNCQLCNGRGEFRTKGNFIIDVVAVDGSLPDDAEHTDGFWYIKKRAIVDEDYVSTLTITTPPTKTAYIEEEVFEPTGMQIKLLPADSDNAVLIEPTYPTEELVFGQTYVTISYIDDIDNKANINQPITVAKRKPVSLKITAPPDKTTYGENTDFLQYGMKVEATYDNGKIYEVAGYTFTPKVTFGQTDITISYSENGGTATTTQPITVIKRTADKLIIIDPLYKKNYIEGDHFYLGDTKVTVTYDSGEVTEITPTFENNTLIYGQTAVTLSYEESGTTVTVDVPITVAHRTPKALKVTKLPNMTKYTAGLKFNKAGMFVEAIYDNDATAMVTRYTFSDVRLNNGQSGVTISYTENGKTVTTNVPITVGVGMYEYDKHICNLHTCGVCSGRGIINTLVRCSRCSGSGRITSSETRTCGSCSGSGRGAQYYILSAAPCYVCGATGFSGQHRHATGEYDPCGSCGGSGSKSYTSTSTCYNCSGSGQTGSIKTCSPCAGRGKTGSKGVYQSTLSALDGSLPNNGEHTDGFWYIRGRQIVDNEYLSNLVVTKLPVKTTYIEGTVFDPTGIETKLVPAGNTNGEIVTATYPTEKVALGQTDITISYTDEYGTTSTTTQPIVVVKKSPTAIRIVTPPEKTEYIENTNFVSVGMKVEATYDNGTKQEVNGYTFPSTVILGQTSILVSYLENGVSRTTSQPITVVEKSLSKITITKATYTARYIEGEIFDLKDSEVSAVYNNADEKVITPTFSNAPLTLGQDFVTLSYEETGISATVNAPITVVDKAPTEIKVTKQPDTTTYSAGLKFKSGGMIVVALYGNGTTKEVTSYTFPNTLLVEGQNKVRLSYSEHGKDLTVYVPITVGPQMAVYEKYESNIRNECEILDANNYNEMRVTTKAGSQYKITINLVDLTIDTDGNAIWSAGSKIDLPASMKEGVSWNVSGWQKSSDNTYFLISQVECVGRDEGNNYQVYKLFYNKIFTGNIIQKNEKGRYLTNVTAKSGSLPANGKHTDGYWYVLKNLIQDKVVAPKTKAPVTSNPDTNLIVTYEKWTAKNGKKQIYLADVEATSGTLPENGIHTDGYYYRKKA